MPVIPSGLIAEYRFDEQAGTVLVDHSTSGYNGTLGLAGNQLPVWNGVGLAFLGTSLVQLPVALWPLIKTVMFFLKVPSGINLGCILGAQGSSSFLLGSMDNKVSLSLDFSTPIVGSGAKAIGNVCLSFLNAAPLRLFLNTTETPDYQAQQQTALTLITPTALYLGLLPGTSGGLLQGTSVYYMVAYDRVLSQSEIEQNFNTVQAILTARGVTLQNAVVRSKGLYVFDGDSITAGSSATVSNIAPGQGPYPTQVQMGVPELASSYAVNLGVGGALLSAININSAFRVDPLLDQVVKGQPQVVFLEAGTNDIAAGSSPATVYGQIVQYCQARKLAGWKVGVFTLLPRTSLLSVPPSTFETNRQALNALIRAGYATFADYLMDIGNDPLIGQPGQSTGPYYTDGTHPDNAGYAIIASYAIAVARLNLPLPPVPEAKITPAQLRTDFPAFSKPDKVATVTRVSISSGLATLTADNDLEQGDLVELSNFGNAFFLNGGEVAVATADGTTFSFNFAHSDYPAAPDSGVARVYQYADSQIQFWLDWAYGFLNAGRWGTQLNKAAELYACHELVLAKEAELTATVGGLPGLGKGIVSAESVDKGSISYDVAAATFKDASHWNSTLYGRLLWRLIRIFGAGPVYVGAGVWQDGGQGAWSGPPTGWNPNW